MAVVDDRPEVELWPLVFCDGLNLERTPIVEVYRWMMDDEVKAMRRLNIVC